MAGLPAWRVAVVEAAESQIGVHELTDHNDGEPATRYTTMSNGTVRNVPWCAYFVRWCYARGGIVIPGNEWQLGAVAELRRQCSLVGRLRGKGELPRPGDIVFYAGRGESDAGPGDHCGIVKCFDLGVVHTIEGNVKHAVMRQQHNNGSKRVDCYGFF